MAQVKNKMILEQEQEFELEWSFQEWLIVTLEGILRSNCSLACQRDIYGFKVPYCGVYKLSL